MIVIIRDYGIIIISSSSRDYGIIVTIRDSGIMIMVL